MFLGHMFVHHSGVVCNCSSGVEISLVWVLEWFELKNALSCHLLTVLCSYLWLYD